MQKLIDLFHNYLLRLGLKGEINMIYRIIKDDFSISEFRQKKEKVSPKPFQKFSLQKCQSVPISNTILLSDGVDLWTDWIKLKNTIQLFSNENLRTVQAKPTNSINLPDIHHRWYLELLTYFKVTDWMGGQYKNGVNTFKTITHLYKRQEQPQLLFLSSIHVNQRIGLNQSKKNATQFCMEKHIQSECESKCWDQKYMKQKIHWTLNELRTIYFCTSGFNIKSTDPVQEMKRRGTPISRNRHRRNELFHRGIRMKIRKWTRNFVQFFRLSVSATCKARHVNSLSLFYLSFFLSLSLLVVLGKGQRGPCKASAGFDGLFFLLLLLLLRFFLFLLFRFFESPARCSNDAAGRAASVPRQLRRLRHVDAVPPLPLLVKQKKTTTDNSKRYARIVHRLSFDWSSDFPPPPSLPKWKFGNQAFPWMKNSSLSELLLFVIEWFFLLSKRSF